MTVTAARRPRRRAPARSVCPGTSSRPLRSWLVVTSALWVTLWAQLAVVPRSWNPDVAYAVFALACLDTVLYGVAMPPRALRRWGVPGLWSSATLGTLTLAGVSWAPFLAVGAFYCVLTRSIAPIAFLLIFGVPVSLGLAVVGYVLLLMLLVLGRGLARLRPPRWRPRALGVSS